MQSEPLKYLRGHLSNQILVNWEILGVTLKDSKHLSTPHTEHSQNRSNLKTVERSVTANTRHFVLITVPCFIESIISEKCQSKKCDILRF